MTADIPWQTIGTDQDPPDGQWCVLLDADDPEDSKIVRAVHGEDWEQAIDRAFWSRHAGDRWLPLVAHDR